MSIPSKSASAAQSRDNALAPAMTPLIVLLNRDGGAVAADPAIVDKVADAFNAIGLDVEIELIGGGDCAVRCRAISERGDKLLVVGGGHGNTRPAASCLAGPEDSRG